MIHVSNAIALVSMLLIGWFCAKLPLTLANANLDSKLFRIADMFSAGVLISTALTHLLPEASEILDAHDWIHESSSGHTHISLSGVLALFGICLMHLVHCMPTRGGSASNTAFVFSGALTVHCIIEGLALGASIASPSAFSAVFTAIMLHKGFAAFTLGSTLVRSKLHSTTSFCYCFIFAISTPLTAFIAHLVLENDKNEGRDTAKLNAVSAGVFIYMALVDMLSSHDHDHNHGIEHNHNHGHETLQEFTNGAKEEVYSNNLHDCDVEGLDDEEYNYGAMGSYAGIIFEEDNEEEANISSRLKLIIEEFLLHETTLAFIFVSAAAAMTLVMENVD